MDAAAWLPTCSDEELVRVCSVTPNSEHGASPARDGRPGSATRLGSICRLLRIRWARVAGQICASGPEPRPEPEQGYGAAEKEDDRQAVVAAGVEKHANDCADDGDTRIQRYVEPAPRPLCHSVILRSPRAARPLAMPHMCRSGRAIGGRLRRALAGGTSGHSAGTDPRSGQAVSLPSTDLPNWLPVNRPTARIVDAARVAVAVDAPRSLQRSMSAEPRRGPPPHRRQGR